jgi:hypothetical protein
MIALVLINLKRRLPFILQMILLIQHRKKNKKRKEINFPGYTYKKEVEEQKSKLVAALKSLLGN